MEKNDLVKLDLKLSQNIKLNLYADVSFCSQFHVNFNVICELRIGVTHVRCESKC